MTDERERDTMWNRIDEHSSKIDDIDKRTVAVEGRVNEHSRQLSDVSTGVSDLHKTMNQMIGGMKSLRFIMVVIGVLVAVVQIADAIGELG